MKLDDLPASVKFMYMSMTQTAIYLKEMGRDRDYFVKFAKEIWDTMELNDMQTLKSALREQMEKDIKNMASAVDEKNTN